MNNENNESVSFDLFAKPEMDNLKEELAKGTYQWTNKFTKVLLSFLIIVSLLSVGAWYGHRSANSISTTGIGNRISSFSANTLPSGAPDAAAIAGGGFGGGNRITGKISKVSGSTVTITLDDPTQATSLRSGDITRISTGVNKIKLSSTIYLLYNSNNLCSSFG